MVRKTEKIESKPKAKKEYQFKLFEALGACDKKDFSYYSRLTEEERKEFSPLVFMRWMTCVESSEYHPYYLTTVNNFLNQNFWELRNHPELVWLLCCATSAGKTQKRTWLQPGKRSKTSFPTLEKMFRYVYPGINNDEMKLLISLQDVSSIEDLAKGLAWNDEEIKSVIKEYKAIK